MKRVLSAEQQQTLRHILQAATIAALMDSRRWEPGDLAFQGGTCLHLAHGSARFSEDLNFRVRGGLSLDGLSKEVQKKLRLPADVPADLSVAVTPGRDARNPHIFYVTLSGPLVVGSVRVKIELWQTQAAALKSLPSSWPMNEQVATDMLQLAITHLQAGVALMQEVTA